MTSPQKPLVSCIIIFLNAGQFIVEAIASVFAQSYENWELLLVDDGSTDSSTVIALDYAQKHPEKIRYFEHENHQNRGMSTTRNLGIAHAQSEYVAFLDADDVWLPEKLSEQVAILQAHPEVALVYGCSQFWYSWTGKAEDRERDYFMAWNTQVDAVIMPPDLLPILWAHSAQAPQSSNAMIRRSVFENFASYEPSFRSSSEDTVFYTKVLLNAPVFAANRFWSKYRQHHRSSMAMMRQSKNRLAHARTFFDWAESYLIEQRQKDTELWCILQKNKQLYCHPLRYFFQRGYLDFIMLLGRKLLPVHTRHYLWLHIGSLLYGQSINSKNHLKR